MLYCQPAPDFLPDPQACLLTGITPQHCLEHGLPEYQFAAAIEQALATPGTIGAGYNTIRFDDEITRFLFWRNLIDPYAREWQNQCGRWDILDLVRTAYALRPEGIVWPCDPNGRPSFRLERLSQANSLSHEAAHDALSDVRATIGLARLIRLRQPKLFEFCLALHKKDRVATEIGLHAAPHERKPFIHVSGMFPAERGCLALMWPLAAHPANKNEVIAWDLAFDPAELRSLDADTIRTRMFSKTDDLPPGITRLPVKTIHLNKSPVVIGNLKTLSPEMAQRWGVNLTETQAHARNAAAWNVPDSLWQQVFQRPPETSADVDEDLYGGFIGNRDRRSLDHLRGLTAQPLAAVKTAFDDPRLEQLFFRYRARNFPASLSGPERQEWEAHRAARLFNGTSGALTMQSFSEQIDALSAHADERGEAILSALYDYAESIAPART